VYDAIIVGARCAGAATAMLLARRGLDVLLVDRVQLPSDIPHGHFIHRHGPVRLRDWGLLERLLATGCSPIASFVEDLDDGFALTGTDLVVDGVPLGLGPRRLALDAMLVEAALEAGVSFREAFPVRELVFDEGRVVGIRGAETTERARFVIGADGRNSTVAKHVEAAVTTHTETLSCWYFSYWSSAPGSALELYLRGRRVVFAFPTNDGLLAVFVSWPRDALGHVRSDPERQIMETLDEIPELAERIRSGTREERIYGATSLPNYLRRPFGPGWALVGDAGCHKDPYLALGICDAFRDAELLAHAVEGSLSGAMPEAQAMGDYESRRNAATSADYERNIYLASGQPIPGNVLAARAAAREDVEATRTYFLAGEGRLE
jgi:flavin-dependent dehydrogenase